MAKRQSVCLITGANSGIGFATSLELAKQDCTVIMVCRNAHRGEAARKKIEQVSQNPNVHLLIADLASQQAIHALLETVRSQFPDLNVLINNAGAIFRRRSVTVDKLEQTFALNHMAYFMLANGLLDVLKANAPARIINVGSFAAQDSGINFDDLQGEQTYHRAKAYQQSKRANLLFTAELARRVQDDKITVNCFNPGNVKTHFGGWMRNLKIEVRRLFFPAQYQAMHFIPVVQSGQDLAYFALDSSLSKISGKCFSGRAVDESLTALDDVGIAQQLWDVSDRLLHDSYAS